MGAKPSKDESERRVQEIYPGLTVGEAVEDGMFPHLTQEEILRTFYFLQGLNQEQLEMYTKIHRLRAIKPGPRWLTELVNPEKAVRASAKADIACTVIAGRMCKAELREAELREAELREAELREAERKKAIAIAERYLQLEQEVVDDLAHDLAHEFNAERLKVLMEELSRARENLPSRPIPTAAQLKAAREARMANLSPKDLP